MHSETQSLKLDLVRLDQGTARTAEAGKVEATCEDFTADQMLSGQGGKTRWP